MADQKITQLTADASPTSDDLVATVNDPAGTPVNRKVTLASIAALFASLTTFTSAFTPRFMGAKAHRTAAQTISNNTDTAMLWTAEEYDTDSIHDTGSNTSRFTVPTGGAGKWRVTVNVMWAANANGVRAVFFRKNGATRLQEDVRASFATFLNGVNLSIDILLADADYIEAVVYQNSGGNLDISVANSNPTMSAYRIGS